VSRNHRPPHDVEPAMIRGRLLLLLLLSVVAAITGCASGAERAAPSSLMCHTQYRPDEESLAGASEPTLTVARVDGATSRPARVDFETLTLEVTYQGDAPEGRNVAIVVSTTNGDPLVRNLYQYTDGAELTTAFAGGHGFTGLEYVFHEGSMLQVWCEAGDA
jgi:hypothetical protein